MYGSEEPRAHRCPFCGRNVLRICVHDDEGNYHGELGCGYETEQ